MLVLDVDGNARRVTEMASMNMRQPMSKKKITLEHWQNHDIYQTRDTKTAGRFKIVEPSVDREWEEKKMGLMNEILVRTVRNPRSEEYKEVLDAMDAMSDDSDFEESDDGIEVFGTPRRSPRRAPTGLSPPPMRTGVTRIKLRLSSMPMRK